MLKRHHPTFRQSPAAIGQFCIAPASSKKAIDGFHANFTFVHCEPPCEPPSQSAPTLFEGTADIGCQAICLAKDIDPETSAAAAAMGRRGGTARAKALTKARRKQIASEAAKARWGDKKKEQTSPDDERGR
jgi:hypothetical protein